MPDAIKLITDDHRAMEKLFERVKKERDRRPELLQEIAGMFVAHSRAEEEKVYPAVAEAGERAEVHHGAEEHHEAEDLLRQVERLDTSGKDFEKKFGTFVEAVNHHVQEEESDVLPSLRDAVSKKRMDELGRAFAERREQELAQHREKAAARSKGELYEEARAMDVHGRSAMNKDELARAVEEEKGR